MQGLLSFARQRPAQREPMQVNAILRQTIRLRSYDFSSHGVEVTEEFNENLQLAMGDPQQLQQVFLNILNNAYDAIQESGKHGKIQVFERGRRRILLKWRSLITAPASASRTAFLIRSYHKHAGKGTGLGLSICYGIVRAHGGEILCWNNERETGSTFVVRLPIATETALAASRERGGTVNAARLVTSRRSC